LPPPTIPTGNRTKIGPPVVEPMLITDEQVNYLIDAAHHNNHDFVGDQAFSPAVKRSWYVDLKAPDR